MSLVTWTEVRCGAAYQNAVREQKLAAEISAAKRERDFYMGQVDKAKGIEAMAERKRKVRTQCCSCISLLRKAGTTAH